MTRKRLQNLTYDKLKDLAKKEGIKRVEEDKDALIEQIIEAWEEDLVEKKLNNNSAMKGEEKKYDILQEEEIEAQIKTVYPIPELYNSTSITMILRDPLWAFAYWDLKATEYSKLNGDPLFEGIYLRVFEGKKKKFTKESVINYFDIPVKLKDRSWYINLPVKGRYYVIKLMSLVNGEEKTLCKSNVIFSPKSSIDFSGDDNNEVILESINDFMNLINFYHFDNPVAGKKIPQRIISLIDTKYMK